MPISGAWLKIRAGKIGRGVGAGAYAGRAG